jgi:outer membrane biosynthesis protein TonB
MFIATTNPMIPVSLLKSSGRVPSSKPVLLRQSPQKPEHKKEEGAAPVIKVETVAAAAAAAEDTKRSTGKRKRDGEDEESPEKKQKTKNEEDGKAPKGEQQQSPKKKQKAKKKKKKQNEDGKAPEGEEEEGDEKEKKKKGQMTVQQKFHHNITVITKTFREVFGGMENLVGQFTSKVPAKRKGGLVRVDETVAAFHDDLWSKIHVFGDIKPIYEARALELGKAVAPNDPEMAKKFAKLAMEMVVDEVTNIVAHVDAECALHTARAIEHLESLPDVPPPK